jgi:hypothetical protein
MVNANPSDKQGADLARRWPVVGVRGIVRRIGEDGTASSDREFTSIDIIDIAEPEHRAFGAGEIRKPLGSQREQPASFRRRPMRFGLAETGVADDAGENCAPE